MAVIMALPIFRKSDEIKNSVSQVREIELLAESLTELQANLDFLREHLVDMRETSRRAVCEVECTAS